VQRSIWFSRRSIGLHVLIVVIVPTFIALCIWQVHRALGGNELSWAYVFEWPFFAGYAIYMWWRFVHETPLEDSSGSSASAVTEGPPAVAGAPAPAPPGAAAGDDGSEDDAERAAYNAYLAELAAQESRKQWR
jgi:hypothetical protein